MNDPVFVRHSVGSAPAAARRAMEATIAHAGYLPAGVGLIATSPQLLEGFLKVSALFEATTLPPLARETVILTIATRNGCHLCVAMHTARLQRIGASAELVTALRTGDPIDDPVLEAVRIFTLRALETAGEVSDAVLAEFVQAGYTPQNALEVVLGIGVYTMSTLANRMTRAPLDPALQPFAWSPHAA